MASRRRVTLVVLAVAVLGIVLYHWLGNYTVAFDDIRYPDFKELFGDYAMPVRVSSGGRLLGTLAAHQELSFSSWGVQHDDAGLPVLAVEAQTPCGWRPIGSTTAKEQGAPIISDIGKGLVIAPNVKRRLVVGYDNRGGGTATLKVGELSLPIAANASGVLRLVSDGCDGDPEVRLNDAVLGQASLTSAPEGDLNVLVADLTGGHCYAAEEVDYGSGTEARHPGSDEKKRLYQFHTPENFEFLTPPADSIKAESFQSRNKGSYYVTTVLWVWDCENSQD